jgi:serpin B
VAVAAPTLASSAHDRGNPQGDGMGETQAGLATSDVRRSAGDPEAMAEVVAAVRSFTTDLYREAARATRDNLVLSPYSVFVALAMTRNGARGTTAEEMDAVLHSPGPGRLDPGTNALTAHVATRAGRRRGADRAEGRVGIAVASSLWGQQGTAWRREFLDALAQEYGTGMHLVDYRTDAERARRRINAWTSEHTDGKILDLVPEGALYGLTRLVLVNAIHFKAPWEEPFESGTTTRPFRLLDGGRVDVELMSQAFRRADYAEGDGWVAARLPYLGRELAMALVVPDDLAAFEEGLDGGSLADLLGSLRPVGPVQVDMPRWDFRSRVALKDTLQALGMPTAFEEHRADFTGMTTDQQLLIDQVLHEALVVVDEKGTEAAAATAVVIRTLSAPARPPRSVVADRPYLFVIHDVATATPLFIGRVTDPR